MGCLLSIFNQPNPPSEQLLQPIQQENQNNYQGPDYFTPGTQQQYSGKEKNYIQRATLGDSQSAKVFLVQQTQTGQYYAMKYLRKDTVNSRNLDFQLKTELEILKIVKSPFLVKFKESFQTADRFYFIMEFVPGGELRRLLHYKQKFDEKTARFYIAEIIIALEYLHKNEIIYRDLRPHNILIDEYGHIKLIDFAISNIGRQSTETAGNVYYQAPEIIMIKYHSMESDFWALGVLLYEMLFEITPFYDEDKELAKQKIIEGRFQVPEGVSKVTRDFICNLLNDSQKKDQVIKGLIKLRTTHFFKELIGERQKNDNYLHHGFLNQKEKMTTHIILSKYNWNNHKLWLGENKSILISFHMQINHYDLDNIIYFIFIKKNRKNIERKKMGNFLCPPTQDQQLVNDRSMIGLEQDQAKIILTKKIADGRISKVYKDDSEENQAIKVIRQQYKFKQDTQILNLICVNPKNRYIGKIIKMLRGQDQVFVLNYYGGGTLRDTNLDPNSIRIVIMELICALDYIHKLNHTHNNLNPDNILFDDEGHIKLVGFSMVDQINTEEHRFTAPENFTTQIIGPHSDWWGVGAILYFLQHKFEPHFSLTDDRNELIQKKIDGSLLEISDEVQMECRDFINKVMIIDPKQRLGTHDVNEIKNHPYFKDQDWIEIEQCTHSVKKPQFIPFSFRKSQLSVTLNQ